MKKIFWIVLKLRLKQKFWGEMFLKWHKRQVNKIVDKINLDVKDIEIK